MKTLSLARRFKWDSPWSNCHRAEGVRFPPAIGGTRRPCLAACGGLGGRINVCKGESRRLRQGQFWARRHQMG